MMPHEQADDASFGRPQSLPQTLLHPLLAGAAWVRDRLVPPTCCCCDAQVEAAGALCVSCWGQLHHLSPPWCSVWGTPFAYDLGADAISPDALAHPPPFATFRAAVAYDDVSRPIVTGFKHRRRFDMGLMMAQAMLRPGRELLAQSDVLVPVPIHWTRRLKRRFNQASVLAEELARLHGRMGAHAVEVRDALVRVRRTHSQVGLLAKAREDNVRGAFRVPPEAVAFIAGRNILLIDDVCTTGATIIAATKALQRAGAEQVSVLAFARRLTHDEPLR